MSDHERAGTTAVPDALAVVQRESGVRRLLRRRRTETDVGDAAAFLGQLVTRPDPLDPGQLVRALARAVVHVPMPGHAREAHPRLTSPADGGPPLYVFEDDGGRHVMAYSSPRAFVTAWGPGVTAASVPMTMLLAGWPADTDLVLDCGTPNARQITVDTLEEAALDAAGVPTVLGTALSPDGWDLGAPDPEPVQVIGAARQIADETPELLGLWRAVTTNREPAPRPLLHVAARFAAEVSHETVQAVMGRLVETLSELEPQPLLMHAIRDGSPSRDRDRDLAEAICAFDQPFWSRPSA